jgi:hypothetical protein
MLLAMLFEAHAKANNLFSEDLRKGHPGDGHRSAL